MAEAQHIEMTRPMRRVEAKLGRPLREYLEERYLLATMAEIAAEIGVSEGTVSRWFDRLAIETRFPGQKPEAVA